MQSFSADESLTPVSCYQAHHKHEQIRNIASELIKRVHLYERIGYDRRDMAFLADGSIGMGTAGREIFWNVRMGPGGKLHLEIASEFEVTCRLLRDSGGIWHGHWLHGEKMPVMVAPTDRSVSEELRTRVEQVWPSATTEGRYDFLSSLHTYPSYARPQELGAENGLQTLLDGKRLHQLTTLLLYSLPLDGDTIECGVYRAGLSSIMAQIERGLGKRHYLCDSFRGLPEPGMHDSHHAGDFSDTSLNNVRQGLDALGLTDGVTIIPGWFNETFPDLQDRRFCFAHIDADYHESTWQCLEFLYPRLLPGGWIVLDDYTWHHCQGVRNAVDTFFTDKPEVVFELFGHAAAVQRQP